MDDLVHPLLNLIISLGLFIATTCSAAVITFRGQDTTGAQQWRTPSVPKPLDPSNDNIYGTDGYVMFNTAPSNSTLNQSNSPVNPFTFASGTLATLTKTPTYVSGFSPIQTGFNSVFSSQAYLNFDNPAGGTIKSGVAYEAGSTSTFTNLFTFTVNSKVPSTFVVGLFFSNSLGEVAQAQITGSAGGAAPGPVPPRTVFNNIDGVFFTIRNAISGEVFTVSALGSTNADANGNVDIMGITFDSVPEPSTLGGCTAAALALLWFGRRSKTARRQITLGDVTAYRD